MNVTLIAVAQAPFESKLQSYPLLSTAVTTPSVHVVCMFCRLCQRATQLWDGWFITVGSVHSEATRCLAAQPKQTKATHMSGQAASTWLRSCMLMQTRPLSRAYIDCLACCIRSKLCWHHYVCRPECCNSDTLKLHCCSCAELPRLTLSCCL
jgi:hypothetical protein